MRTQIAFSLILYASYSFAADEQSRTIRYNRPAGSQYVREFKLTRKPYAEGHSISSVTRRGQTHLSLVSEFDTAGHLRSAKVAIDSGTKRQTAQAHSEGTSVTVKRANGLIDVLDCPRGVIVTSAPDWTDTFMVTRRYDENKGGEQQFDGLWIHPTREPLRLTFRVRHEGTDTVECQGETHRLERISIVLRNESRYVAWRDGRRQLVRLVADGREQPSIVLDGWQEATRHLAPKP